jgi:TetR/AcrR family transcriptional repressor of nem operon
MEKAPGRKAISHERIVEAASRVVRRSGLHGTGVADVMNEAGLTHGGFYSHFESRDELLAEAIARASSDIAEVIKANVVRLKQQGLSDFRALVETYLLNEQIADCENGCPVAALCAQMPSQAPQVIDSSRLAVANLHRLVQNAMPRGTPRDAAWAVTSALIGAMQLARTLGDNKEGRSVLAATKKALLANYDN